MRSPHQPQIIQSPSGAWMVECSQCRSDTTSQLPIGIGLPLQDRVAAERLAQNHCGRRGSRGAAPECRQCVGPACRWL